MSQPEYPESPKVIFETKCRAGEFWIIWVQTEEGHTVVEEYQLFHRFPDASRKNDPTKNHVCSGSFSRCRSTIVHEFDVPKAIANILEGIQLT